MKLIENLNGKVNSESRLLGNFMKNEISLIVQKVTGRSELNLEFGNVINELGYDYTNPKMDKKIKKEINKENSKQKKDLYNKFRSSQKSGDVDEAKRYKILLDLDLPFNFIIDRSVDLFDNSIIEIIIQAKEDYLRIPARFRGLKSPEVRFVNLPRDHPAYHTLKESDQKNVDLSAACFYITSYGPEIAVCTNSKYYSEAKYELVGSTISPIVHEFGHFVETVLGSSPNSKVIDIWKNIMSKEYLRLKGFTRKETTQSAKELFADAFMEYTTGGLRRENILNNIIKGNVDKILDIIKEMIIKGDDSNDFFAYLFAEGDTMNDLEVTIFNAIDGFRTYNFYEYRQNMKSTDDIIHVRINPSFDKLIFTKNLQKIIKGDLNYGGSEHLIIDDIIGAIREYGNLGDFDSYIFKGRGLLDEFKSIRDFFTNYIGEGFLKSYS